MMDVYVCRRLQRHTLLMFLGMALCLCASSSAQVEANPGRPTVSTPATLTPLGYLQFESGILGAEVSGEFANRTGIEEVVKLTVAQRLEAIVQTEPLVLADLGPEGTSAVGDVSVGLQAVVLPGKKHRPAIAVSYFRRLYSSSAPDVDIGSSRQTALVLASFDWRKFHIDTNAIFAEQIQDQTHRAQYGQTFSVSHPAYGALGLTAELWHFTQPLLRSNAAGFLFAPTYTLKPNMVLDAGFNRGLTITSTRWQVFAGFTYLLPKKLW